MEINKVELLKLSNFNEGERVYISIVRDSRKVVIEPLSSESYPELLEDESLKDLGIGDIVRTFGSDEVPDEFGIIMRVC
jgi:hypothetical protein